MNPKYNSNIKIFIMTAYFIFCGINLSGQEPTEYVPNQILVKLKKNTTSGRRQGILNKIKAKVKKRFKFTDTELWSFDDINVEEALTALQGEEDISYIEPDYIVHAYEFIPNDPSFSQLWGMHNTGQTGGTVDADIDAADAWSIHTGGDVLVGIIDTGVDYNHVDLADNIWINPGEIPNNSIDDDGNGFIDDVRGWDFVNDDNDPMDDHYHGTHCAGTIAGVGNNGIGVAGVSWSAKIVPIKFLNSSGSGSTSDAIAAVEYARIIGAKLTSNSWGGGSYSQTLHDAIRDAGDAGQLFIAAAGNDASNNDAYPHYPSSYDLDNIIAVASTDHNDNLSSFSCYGATSVDLGAPGSSIYSTSPGNAYRVLSGTSMATPHVSGAVCLIWSYVPSLPHTGLKDIIMNSVDPVSSLSGITVSGGRLNVFNALNMAEPDSTPPDPVSDLTITNTGSNWLTINWTTTGDDSSTGTAHRYDVRYNTVFIDESNFDSSTEVPNTLVPQSSGSTETYTITDLDFNTTYFVALKVIDEQNNASMVSNSPSGTTLGIPDISVSPSSLSESLNTGESSTQQLTISNDAAGTLDFSLPGFSAENLLNNPQIPKNPSSDDISREEYGKNEYDSRQGHPVILGAGGPDNFGYSWIDSDEPGGPVFQWNDISTTGTLVTGLSDDNFVGPFSVSFDIMHYENTYNQFYIQSNGLISFDNQYITLSNQPIPTMDGYNNFIACCWDDLYPNGSVYYQDFGNRVIIQFTDYGEFGGSGYINAQVILMANGHILLQYLNTYNGFDTEGCSIGIENQDGSDGLQVAFNTAYIHDSLAVSIASIPDWLSVDPTSGSVSAGSSMVLDVHFDASGMYDGDYSEDILISSNDPDESELIVPANLHVTGTANIVADSDTLNFGSFFVGASKSLAVDISNNGTAVLNVSDVNLNHADFSVDTTSFSLDPFLHLQIMVAFSPTSVGTISGNLTITSNDPDMPTLIIYLTGEGLLPPHIAVSPDSLSADLMAGTAETQTLRIDNSGDSMLKWVIETSNLVTTAMKSYKLTAPLIDVSVDADGGSAGGQNIRTTPIQADLADLTDIRILWDRAHGQGSSSGWSVIISDVTSRGATVTENLSTITSSLLSGYDLLWTIDINSSWTSAEVSAIQSWINSGGALLLEGDNSSTVPIYNQLLSALGCGIQYSSTVGASGSTTNIFSHKTTENVATIYLDANIASLSSVTSPASNLINDVANVPNTAFSTVGWGRIIAMADEIFIDYRMGLDDNQLFANQVFDWLVEGSVSWLVVAPDSGSVEPGQSQNVDVTFDAEKLNGGEYDANVLVTSNDPDYSEITVPAHLNVTGIPDIAVDADTLDFGAIFIGGSKERTLLVTNSGTDLLTIHNMTTGQAQYTTNITNFTVKPDSSKPVIITFLPNSLGSITCDLAITSDDPDESTITVFLTGEGLIAPEISVSPDSLESHLLTDETETQILTLNNGTGASDLNFDIRILSSESSDCLDFDRENANHTVGINNSGTIVSSEVKGNYPRAVGDFTLKSSSPVSMTCVCADPHTGYIYAQENQGYNFYKYDPFADTWSALSSSPIYSGNNGGAIYLSGKIYTCYTSNTTDLGVYNVNTDTWSTITNGLGSGTGNITTDGSYIYMVYYNTFARYNPGNAVWTILTNPPFSFQKWGGLAYHDGKIYGHEGNSLNEFGFYNIATNTWVQLTNVPGGTVLGIAIDPIEEILYCYGSYSGTNWYAYDLNSQLWSVSTIPLFNVNDGGLAYNDQSGTSGIYFVQGESGTGLGRFETLPIISWLSLTPKSGTLSGGSLQNINATFDATGMNKGEYSADIFIASNDPDDPEIVVPASLCVHNMHEPVTDLDGSISGNNIALDWSCAFRINEYNVYRDTVCDFVPDTLSGNNRIGSHVTDENPGCVGVQWTDTDQVIGNPNNNFFYVVTTLGSAESDPSNRFGEFDFNIMTTPSTDFNEIALPLSIPDVTDAAGLLNSIPGCNSVAYWDATMQGYYQYVPALPFTNFTVEMGYPYYVNATLDTVFTIVGGMASPSFNLITTPTTDFNEIMLLLDKTYIKKASELLVDIPNCNSVAYWDAATQGYYQYVSVLPFTDFDVAVGYPYYVNVTDNVVWPSGSPAKCVDDEQLFKNFEDTGTHAPHIVWGHIINDDDTTSNETITFSAYIESRPSEKLDISSAACTIENGCWMIQCAGFPSKWKAGEILIVKFLYNRTKASIVKKISLTYEPFDQCENINLVELKKIPTTYKLSQNYPNPFNPETTIQYEIPKDGRVQIIIYNTQGQEIRKLVDEKQKAGYFTIHWTGDDEYGRKVSSGVYIIRLRCEDFIQSKKLLLVK